jgi:hypothetical protein
MLAKKTRQHPIGLLRRLGFRVTVNTDNRLMSGTSMSREMELLNTLRNLPLAKRRLVLDIVLGYAARVGAD